MYQTKALQAFINKVNEEAEKAAQAVYDKHLPELIKRIQNQIKENDIVWTANGTCSIDTKNENGDYSNFEDTIRSAEQHQVCAGYRIPYKIFKTYTED